LKAPAHPHSHFCLLQQPVLAPLSDSVKQRTVLIEQQLANALRDTGYPVLAPLLVRSLCRDSVCAEGKQKLINQYGVNGFFTLTLNSVQSTDFLAGYYNTISGSLRLTDVQGTELLSTEHQESERGGLLFNSGQIVQGVLSQIENSSDSSFPQLAERFTRSIVRGLPVPRYAKANEADQVALTGIEVHPVAPSTYRICVNGTPQSLGSIIWSGRKSLLREERAGRYCGIYLFDESVPGVHEVRAEIASPYGTAVREPVDLASQLSCVRPEFFALNRAAYAEIALTCKQTAREGLSCTRTEDLPAQKMATLCMLSKYFVYRATTRSSPYLRIAEVRTPRWTDKSAPGQSPDSRYQVIALDEKGLPSLPIALR
jgi:hypothetical protein